MRTINKYTKLSLSKMQTFVRIVIVVLFFRTNLTEIGYNLFIVAFIYDKKMSPSPNA